MLPPSGTHTGGATHPQVTFASLAHPRLSMVGPLRGPSADEIRAGFCGGRHPRGVYARKWGIPSAGYGMVDLLRGLNPGRILRRPLFISHFSLLASPSLLPLGRESKLSLHSLIRRLHFSLFIFLLSTFHFPFFTFHFSCFTSTAARLSAWK